MMNDNEENKERRKTRITCVVIYFMPHRNLIIDKMNSMNTLWIFDNEEMENVQQGKSHSAAETCKQRHRFGYDVYTTYWKIQSSVVHHLKQENIFA